MFVCQLSKRQEERPPAGETYVRFSLTAELVGSDLADLFRGRVIKLCSTGVFPCDYQCFPFAKCRIPETLHCLSLCKTLTT